MNFNSLNIKVNTNYIYRIILLFLPFIIIGCATSINYYENNNVFLEKKHDANTYQYILPDNDGDYLLMDISGKGIKLDLNNRSGVLIKTYFTNTLGEPILINKLEDKLNVILQYVLDDYVIIKGVSFDLKTAKELSSSEIFRISNDLYKDNFFWTIWKLTNDNTDKQIIICTDLSPDKSKIVLYIPFTKNKVESFSAFSIGKDLKLLDSTTIFYSTESLQHVFFAPKIDNNGALYFSNCIHNKEKGINTLNIDKYFKGKIKKLFTDIPGINEKNEEIFLHGQTKILLNDSSQIYLLGNLVEEQPSRSFTILSKYTYKQKTDGFVFSKFDFNKEGNPYIKYSPFPEEAADSICEHVKLGDYCLIYLNFTKANEILAVLEDNGGILTRILGPSSNYTQSMPKSTVDLGNICSLGFDMEGNLKWSKRLVRRDATLSTHHLTCFNFNRMVYPPAPLYGSSVYYDGNTLNTFYINDDREGYLSRFDVDKKTNGFNQKIFSTDGPAALYVGMTYWVDGKTFLLPGIEGYVPAFCYFLMNIK